MHVVEMLSDEVADLAVSRNSLVPTIFGFVTSCWAFDAEVVHERYSFVWDLGFENEDDVAVEDCTSASPSLREAG